MASHPSEYKPEKYIPFELLKIQKHKLKMGIDELDEFESVIEEEIDEKEKKKINQIVSELTQMRTKELPQNLAKEQDQILRVSKSSNQYMLTNRYTIFVPNIFLIIADFL